MADIFEETNKALADELRGALTQALENGVDANNLLAFLQENIQDIQSREESVVSNLDTEDVIEPTPSLEDVDKRDFLDYFTTPAWDSVERMRNIISAQEDGEKNIQALENELTTFFEENGIEESSIDVVSISSRSLALFNSKNSAEIASINFGDDKCNVVVANLKNEPELEFDTKGGKVVNKIDVPTKEAKEFEDNIGEDTNINSKLTLSEAIEKANKLEKEAVELRKEIKMMTSQAYADGIMPEHSKDLVDEKTALLVEKQKEIAKTIRSIGLKETVKDSVDKAKQFFKKSVEAIEDKTGIFSKTAVKLAVVADLCRMDVIAEGIKNIRDNTRDSIEKFRDDYQFNKRVKDYEKEVHWANHDQKTEDISRDTLTREYQIAKAAKEHFEALEEKRIERENRLSSIKESLGEIKTAFGNIGRVITGAEVVEFNERRDNVEKPVSEYVRMANYYKNQMKEIKEEFDLSKSQSLQRIENIKSEINEKYKDVLEVEPDQEFKNLMDNPNEKLKYYSDKTGDYLDTDSGFAAVIDQIEKRSVEDFSSFDKDQDFGMNRDIKSEIRLAKKDIRDYKKEAKMESKKDSMMDSGRDR